MTDISWLLKTLFFFEIFGMNSEFLKKRKAKLVTLLEKKVYYLLWKQNFTDLLLRKTFLFFLNKLCPTTIRYKLNSLNRIYEFYMFELHFFKILISIWFIQKLKLKAVSFFYLKQITIDCNKMFYFKVNYDMYVAEFKIAFDMHIRLFHIYKIKFILEF